MHTNKLRVRVLVMETKHGTKSVFRGDEIEITQDTYDRAPFAYEILVGGAERPAEEPAAPPLFQDLMAQDRANKALLDQNTHAQRRRLAEQWVAQAMALLGVKTKGDPLQLSLRLSALMGYDAAEHGPDPLIWAAKHLEQFHGHTAALYRERADLQDQCGLLVEQRNAAQDLLRSAQEQLQGAHAQLMQERQAAQEQVQALQQQLLAARPAQAEPSKQPEPRKPDKGKG